MEIIEDYYYYLMHLDEVISYLIGRLDNMIYVLLFGIIFAETGLIVVSFLPGDSLLFAAGAFAGIGDLNIYILVIGFFLAATLGDFVNYNIGRYIGNRQWITKVVSPSRMANAELFFKKYGGVSVILARFMPIVRSLVPFVAGVSRMQYRQFMLFNMTGALIWGVGCSLLGYFFGNITWVKDNFSIVLFLIMATTFLPVVVSFYRTRSNKMKSV